MMALLLSMYGHDDRDHALALSVFSSGACEVAIMKFIVLALFFQLWGFAASKIFLGAAPAYHVPRRFFL